jgi:hypothetical protein
MLRRGMRREWPWYRQALSEKKQMPETANFWPEEENRGSIDFNHQLIAWYTRYRE